MRWAVAIGIVVLAGCPREDASMREAPRGSAAVIVVPRAADGPPPATSPHGGTIQLTAVTEEGDAALTVDDLGTLRLWPVLDGKVEPRVVRAAAPKDVVLVRDGVALLAGILDQAGGIELVRLDREGRVTDRVRLPAEPPCLELHGVAGGVLALHADQSVVWYDARGGSRGRLVPEVGTRIASLAVRKGRAVALIATATTTPVRWIELSDRLLWGPTVELPVTLEEVVLSPSHRRIAGIVKGGEVGVVIDLEPKVSIVTPDLKDRAGASARRTGTFDFTDDDHILIANNFQFGWWAPPEGDPWAPSALTTGAVPATSLAFGSGIVTGGVGAMLVVIDPLKTRYLGYRELAIGFASPVGDHATLNSGGHLVWLDRDLRAIRSSVTADEKHAIAMAIGDHHVLTAGAEPNAPTDAEGRTETTIAVRDLASSQVIVVARRHDYSNLTYDVTSSVVAVATETTVDRYQIDLAKGTATALRPLTLRSGGALHPRDPKLADGLVAIAISYDDTSGGQRIETFVEVPGTRPLRATSSVLFDGDLLGIDRTGTAFVGRFTDTTFTIVGYRKGKAISKAVVEAPSARGAVARDGHSIVLVLGSEVLSITPTGAVRWRFPVWRAHTATFSGDDRTVIVQAQGGLIALDTTTGARVAQACGWGFGSFEEPVAVGTFGVTTLCEEGSP